MSNILGQQRNDLTYKIEEGTSALRHFVESTIVSGTPDIDRITKYTLYMNFYKGKHWRQYDTTFLKFNYCKAFVDKIINFLLGTQAFTTNVISLDNKEVDKKVETALEGFVEYNWRKNNKLLTCYELMQMGSVCGDAWLLLQYNTEEKFVEYRVADSRHCFPEFLNGNVNELKSFVIRQPLVNNQAGYRVFCSRFSKEKITTWYQKDLKIGDKKFDEKEVKNPYGFIPIIHFKNKPTSDDYFSRSDLADILSLNKAYNETAQELKNTIDYHGSPVTVITGANAKSLTKGMGKIWSGLPAEANVFNLGLGDDTNAIMEFMQLLKTGMHELSDVPENALGKIQAISNTSAAALQVTYQPLIQQAQLKWFCYAEGIIKVNDYTIKIFRKLNKEFPLFKELPDENAMEMLRMEPIFKYGLPQDQLSEIQIAQSELSAKVASKREIMERMGKKNIPKIQQEIEQEAQADAEMANYANELAMSSMGGGGGENTPPEEPMQKGKPKLKTEG